jgi:hypothetical protein
MARGTFFNFPVDTPAIEKTGVMHKESDSHFNAKHLTLPREDTVRSGKGDLPMETIADFDPHPLSHEGVPFKNLRGSK